MATWFVVGISGISCSGKTTLANGIRDRLTAAASNTPIADDVVQLLRQRHVEIGTVQIIHQDSYFYPIDSAEHIWIPDLKHINREHLGALDTARLLADIHAVIASPIPPATPATRRRLNILIVEGHLIFNHSAINDLLNARLCLDITFEVCGERRRGRVYPQPTPAGYFERFVWPLYRVHFGEFTNAEQRVHVLGGGDDPRRCLDEAMHAICAKM